MSLDEPTGWPACLRTGDLCLQTDPKGTHEMNRQQEPEREKQEPLSPEIQQSNRRSISADERMKRVIKQHPQRDEPKVDSIEPDETPVR